MGLQTPVGSDVQEVRAFLHSQLFGSKRFVCGPYYHEPDVLSVLLKYTNNDKAKELGATLGGYLVATIPDVGHDHFNQSNIIAEFYFDKNDRLIFEKITEELSK